MIRSYLSVKLAAISFFLCSLLFSQTDSLKLSLANYKFIKYEKNNISNASGLDNFFESLYQLKTIQKEIVSVVHIGDSHLQADFFSGILRQMLQRFFGNSGRGLIFPYKAAKTNEPYNYKTSSPAVWESNRCVYPNKDIPTGVSGITVETSDRKALLNLKTFNYPGLDYSFNHVDVFHERDSFSYKLALYDTSGNIIVTPQQDNNRELNLPAVFNLPAPTDNIILGNVSEDTLKQLCTRIYGIVLRNDSIGLIYHTIGVNGAMYQHYNKSKHFAVQLKTLHPDLIIVSLGTNEAQSLKMTNEEFYTDVDTLIHIMRSYTGAHILLTLPQDSYRKKWHYNLRVKSIAETLSGYAIKNNLAYWDYYTIAGGYKSCYLWRKKGLMRNDGLHLSRTGYEIQGKLLYTAILNAYNRYVSDRHP